MKKVIAAVISSDTESRSEEDFLNSVNDEDDLEYFSVAGRIPDHLTKCCAELLMGSDLFNSPDFDVTEFQAKVVYQAGRHLPDNESGIEMRAQTGQTADAAASPEGDDDDEAGADVSMVWIISRILDARESDDVKALDNRIRYIIDATNRGRFHPPTFSNSMTAVLNPDGIDNSIRCDVGVECRWIRNTDSDTLKERVSLYRCYYQTAFG